MTITIDVLIIQRYNFKVLTFLKNFNKKNKFIPKNHFFNRITDFQSRCSEANKCKCYF